MGWRTTCCSESPLADTDLSEAEKKVSRKAMKVQKLAHFPKLLDSNWLGTTLQPSILGVQKKHACWERRKESDRTHLAPKCRMG